MKPILFTPPKSPYLVPYDESFRVKHARTNPKSPGEKDELRERLAELCEELEPLQQKLYAHDHYSVLLVFQAMDAAGKDGTIRAVTRNINPAGCQVYSFKNPSDEELDHDFLWRINRALPERGRIGIFNRSHYEEVLVVRVHPQYLDGQHLPRETGTKNFWQERYESMRDLELHLARSGTVVLKFWLNVSREEQTRRLLERIEQPESNWKFQARDVEEREHWDDYMQAYEDALNATARPWAPWYAVPADNKAYMRVVIAEILVETLKSLDLRFPTVSKDKLDEMRIMGARLMAAAREQKKAKKKKKK